MSNLHPYRYPAGFRAQLDRLEALCPGITTQGIDANPSRDFIEIEHRCASPLNILERNFRLRHIEALIADWKVDGETAFVVRPADVMHSIDDQLCLSQVQSSVIYVEFDDRQYLSLDSQPRSSVEGFYMREVVSEGSFCAEITFVCDEPAWATMGYCTFADAMEVGSRISVGIIPLGQEFSYASVGQMFGGDAALTADPAILRAVPMVGAFAETGLRTSPSPSAYRWRPS